MTRTALAWTLIVFGLAGLLTFGSLMTLLLRPVPDAAAWRSMTGRMERSLDAAAAAARSADTTLRSTSASAGRVAALLDGLATTLRDGSAALQVRILGSQPFAEVAASFRATADRAAAAAAEVATTTTAVEVTRTSIATLASDLAAMSEDVRRLSDVGDDLERLSAWRWLAVLVAAWFAAGSIVMAAAGVWIRRPLARELG